MGNTLFSRTFTEVRKKKKNIVLEQVLVENYAAEGKSLARQDGKVIFIEGAVPGDVVDVRLGKSKKDWAEGHPLRFHSYSKERVEPFASILACAAAANGRCCLMKNSSNTSTSR